MPPVIWQEIANPPRLGQYPTRKERHDGKQALGRAYCRPAERLGLLSASAGFAPNAAMATTAQHVALATQQIPDIAYTRFTLPNGLTVIVHEDHKAPVVAVSIWYHIGSADEPKGKTGFAHLFEHLMF